MRIGQISTRPGAFLSVMCNEGELLEKLQAAKTCHDPIFFADLTVRHPNNDNAELLWHCGPFPYKLKKEDSKPKLSGHYLQEACTPALAEFEIKSGEITICRFDFQMKELALHMQL